MGNSLRLSQALRKWFRNECYGIFLEIIFIWRLLSLSELTPIIFNMELTHLGFHITSFTIIYKIFFVLYKLRPPSQNELTKRKLNQGVDKEQCSVVRVC